MTVFLDIPYINLYLNEIWATKLSMLYFKLCTDCPGILRCHMRYNLYTSFNQLWTKPSQFYLNVQSVPRSKHLLGYKDRSLRVVWGKLRCFVWVRYKRYKYSVGRMYNFWMLRLVLKQKVKWSRYRPGVAQRVGRVIALLFHDRGTRRGYVVSSTLRPHFTSGKDLVPILQEAGWKISSSQGFDPGAFSP
jgi:hypothetical protein